MFGGAEAVKQDLEAIKARKFFDELPRYYAGMSPGLLAKLGALIKSKGDTVDMSVPPDYFEYLQKKVLVKNGLARVNEFGEFRLTTAGLNIGEASKKANLPAVVKSKLPALSPSTMLQTLVRDARADLQTMMQFKPFFMDKWWWRSTAWSLRKWWSGTNPNAKPFVPPEPIHLWSDDDQQRNSRMWMESKFKAFWLCPTGIDKGLQHLNTIDELKKQHGALCLDAARAVGEFAELCSLLPPVKPLTPVQQIEKHMYDKNGEFSFEEFADRHGQVLRVEWQGEVGKGKTRGVNATDGDPFITFHNNVVEATEEAKKVADIQGGVDFDEATRKGRRKKPKQFQLIDQFDKMWAEMEAKTEPTVPYRVGIPIENPCYLHADECDCDKVLPRRGQFYAPMPKVAKPRKAKK